MTTLLAKSKNQQHGTNSDLQIKEHKVQILEYLFCLLTHNVFEFLYVNYILFLTLTLFALLNLFY